METYEAVYQTGGWANFKWHRCLRERNPIDAYVSSLEVRIMGYPCRVMRTSDIERDGLPREFVRPEEAWS